MDHPALAESEVRYKFVNEDIILLAEQSEWLTHPHRDDYDEQRPTARFGQRPVADASQNPV